MYTREGVQRRHEPRKNDLWASRFAEWPPGPAKPSPCLSTCLWVFAILSQRPAFWSPIFGLHDHQKPFFQKISTSKIFYNDTLTFFITNSILIEIKGLIFVVLNFQNSLNCEDIKLDKYHNILQRFQVQIKGYQCQFTKHSSFCKMLKFVLLLVILQSFINYYFWFVNWNIVWNIAIYCRVFYEELIFWFSWFIM